MLRPLVLASAPLFSPFLLGFVLYLCLSIVGNQYRHSICQKKNGAVSWSPSWRTWRWRTPRLTSAAGGRRPRISRPDERPPAAVPLALHLHRAPSAGAGTPSSSPNVGESQRLWGHTWIPFHFIDIYYNSGHAHKKGKVKNFAISTKFPKRVCQGP